MKAAAVVPAYNVRQAIPVCLEALLRQTRQPDAIYIVDNGSTDGTYEWVLGAATQESRIRILREWNRGPSAARNAVLGVAEEEIIAFIDADCVAKPDWLEQHLAMHTKPNVGAIAGYVGGYEPHTLVERYLSVAAFCPPEEDRVVRADVFPFTPFYAGNCSVQSAVLRSVGGFDTTMKSCEDWDLCARLLRAGWHVAYAPLARVDHMHRATLRGMVKSTFLYGAGRPRVLAKNCPGQVILLAGRRTFVWRDAPATVCINLTTPEKISIGLAFLALVSSWFAVPLVLYWMRLAARLRRTAERREVEVGSAADLAGITGLHVLEFLVGAISHVWHSPRNRVLYV
jgi:GT2 family glycosyltransferase